MSTPTPSGKEIVEAILLLPPEEKAALKTALGITEQPQVVIRDRSRGIARSGPLRGVTIEERERLDSEFITVWATGPTNERGVHYERGDSFETSKLRRIKLGSYVSETEIAKEAPKGPKPPEPTPKPDPFAKLGPQPVLAAASKKAAK